MALIDCPECSKEISDRVKSCPHCGYPFESENETAQKVGLSPVKFGKAQANKRKMVIYSLFVILLCVVLYVGGVAISRQIGKQDVYKEATELFSKGNYQEAIEVFNSLGDYKDAKQKAAIANEKLVEMYEENFNLTAALIYVNNLVSQLKCSYISETWDSAIKNEWQDFNIEVNSLIERWDENGILESGEESKKDIDERMVALQNPEPGYEEAHRLLVEMYGLYVQMYEQSKNPTGSLITYNSAIKDLSSDFEKLYNQITVIKPQIKSKVDEEKSNIEIDKLIEL